METDTLTLELNQIFREIFDDPKLVITDTMSAKDVEEWDSLNHINLIVAIEKKFRVKFSTKEVMGWQTVGDMLRHLRTKISPSG